MKLALNGATMMNADLETDIRAASAAGFDALEIWASKLRAYLSSRTAADLSNLFVTHNIRPYSINSIECITFRDEPGHSALLAECDELCRIAQVIRCPYIVVVPSPSPSGVSSNDIISESAQVLGELA